MNKKLLITIFILIITVLVAVLLVSINAGKRYDIVSPEGDVVIKEEDVISSLKASAKLLRKDKQEVVATVDGIEITAHTLNLYRTSKALSDRGTEYSEEELIDQIAKNLAIEKVVLNETGFTYEEPDDIESLKGDEETDKVYADAAGLTVSEYYEMRSLNKKNNTLTLKFDGYICAKIASREYVFKDTLYDKYYESYQKAIDDSDLNKASTVLMEIYDFYVQQLIENADIKIY